MSDYPMLISNKLHSFRNFVVQKYEKQRKHTKEKLQARRPHIPHNHNHNHNHNRPPGICELRPIPPARTPKTPATNTETPAPAHRKLRLRLVARKEGFGNPKPSLHRTAPKPSLSISKSPIRGTRAEYLRRLPSRPHQPHWDPWRASAGNSNGRSGYPYPATRARRPERPKRPHCRSAG